MLSNTAVTLHHLALLCTKIYSLSINTMSICLLLDVFQGEGYSAGLDVDAMVACRHRTMGGHQKGGQVVSGLPSIEDVEDEHHFLFDCSAYGHVLLLQTSSTLLSQMHVVLFSESVLHVGSLLLCIILT